MSARELDAAPRVRDRHVSVAVGAVDAERERSLRIYLLQAVPLAATETTSGVRCALEAPLVCFARVFVWVREILCTNRRQSI